MTCSKIARPVANSLLVILRGGMNLMTSKTEVESKRRPLSAHNLDTFDAIPRGGSFPLDGGLNAGCRPSSHANSMATMRPCPRTSTIQNSGIACISCRKSKQVLGPRDYVLEDIFLLENESLIEAGVANARLTFITSVQAIAAAQLTALPAYVPPIVPGGIISIRPLELTTPLNGNPFASPFANTMTSGLTPLHSHAKYFPQRPKPLWTSSKMRAIPCSSQLARSAERNDVGAGM
jgi:hypothetical protein